ncbi:MAG: N-acetylmuramoyl-L-alanine amidase, partial [Oscillospiraceae bacterium]
IAGNVKIESTYSTYITENDDKSETFTLIGTNAPNVKSNMTDNSVILTFYNTTALPDIVPIKTELFKNIMKVKVAENTYQLHFIFKTGIKPAGFDFKYTGENYKDFKITFNYYRKLSDDVTKPLTNISVLLDPGCGGKDVGNMSVAGIYGPTEKEINLAVALKTKELLESLGATVQLTRYDDKIYSVSDRMRVYAQANPDFFISIHHNSLTQGKNVENISGVEVYYADSRYEEFSKLLSENVALSTNRKNLSAVERNDIITQITSCPTVILQSGYISNPAEFNEILKPMNIYRTACGVANTILEYTNKYS